MLESIHIITINTEATRKGNRSNEFERESKNQGSIFFHGPAVFSFFYRRVTLYGKEFVLKLPMETSRSCAEVYRLRSRIVRRARFTKQTSPSEADSSSIISRSRIPRDRVSLIVNVNLVIVLLNKSDRFSARVCVRNMTCTLITLRFRWTYRARIILHFTK